VGIGDCCMRVGFFSVVWEVGWGGCSGGRFDFGGSSKIGGIGY
jgi:hypothetical protein